MKLPICLSNKFAGELREEIDADGRNERICRETGRVMCAK